MVSDYDRSADFTLVALEKLAGVVPGNGKRVLDFGCGRGDLLDRLVTAGHDVSGCDVDRFWRDASPSVLERCRPITMSPYRLPFEDDTFDAVISTSVLEHVLNKEETLAEICRVTRPDGVSIHLFPSRWYLPREPHLRVPLVNYVHPWRPRLWYRLFAALGVRNQDQQGMSAAETVESNMAYSQRGLRYWPLARYREECMKSFGDFDSPMEFYVEHSYGGVARRLRQLPLRSLTAELAGVFRMRLIMMRKVVAPSRTHAPEAVAETRAPVVEDAEA